MHHWKTAACAAALLSACGGAAWASDAAGDAAGRNEVGEIVVTAQKREQKLQDVPIVVSAVGAQELQDAGVRDIKDLPMVFAGMNVSNSTSEAYTAIRLRGVGTVGDNPGLESSVGVVIDGVYRARTGVAFGDLGELDRVEVLKGPQGTLFGRNTSAGVLNILTAAPAFTFGAKAEATFGNYGQVGGSASVTGPVVDDQLAGRLFVTARKRGGFYDVAVGEGPRTLKEDSTQDYVSARGQLLWTPNDGVRVRIIGDYSNRYESCCVNVAVIAGPTGAYIDALASDAGTARPANPFARLAYANRSSDQKIKDSGLSAQVDHELGERATLTSLTAYRRWKLNAASDQDFSSADIWHRTPQGYETGFGAFSQEVRLAGTAGPLSWLVGGYYGRETLNQVTAYSFGVDYEPYFGLLLSAGGDPTRVSALTGLPYGRNFPAGGGSHDAFHQVARSFALFTNESWRITEALEVTIGLRYTDESKSLDARYSNVTPADACRAAAGRALPASTIGAICAPTSDFAFDDAITAQSQGDAQWTGTIKAAYRLSPDLMTYASAARGFKSGGFNLDRSRQGIGVIQPDTSFPAETVDSYELGAKSTLFGRSLQLNATLFWQTFEDFQLNAYTGVSFVVASLPKVTSRGADIDFVWNTPVEGLQASGGLTYAETQYGDFTPPPGVSSNLPNTRLSFAPLYSAAVTVSYERPVGAGLKLRTNLNGKYSSSYNTGSNLDPRKVQPGFALFNARIGLGAEDDRWDIELWAQNLTDKNYYQVMVDQPLQSGTYGGFLGPPRTYGMTLRTAF